MSFPRYPKYKDSGVEWLGQVPMHWHVMPLKRAVHDFYSGGTPDTDNDQFWSAEETAVQWVAIADMTRSPVVQYTEKRLTAAGIASKRLRILAEGTVLFSMYASLGKVATLGVPACINQAILAFTPSESVLGNAFLRYWLVQIEQHLGLFSSSNTQANLNAEKVRSLPLFIPSLREQIAIAAFLDRETAKIDALVAEQERLITLLMEKRQAVISHAVTKGLNPNAPMKDSGVEWIGKVPSHWGIERCGRHASVVSGFAFPSAGFSSEPSLPKLLRGVNVGVGTLRWDDVVYWQRSEGDELDPYVLKEGDVVIGMDRPLIAQGVRVAEVTRADLPCLLLQRVASVRPRGRLQIRYLKLLLGSPMFAAHFSPDTTGVSVPHISPEQIMDFVVPVPTVPEQDLLVRHVENVVAECNALVAEAQRAIDLFLERRTALISAAVTGQIDVRPESMRTAA